MPGAWMRFALGLAALVLVTSTAAADDWIASRLRGPVLQLDNGKWVPLNRGDVIPNDRAVRTLATGHVTFVRGGETVDLGPNTQIQIHDKVGAKPFTTVTQSSGQVTVKAEVENVQHFAVQTPFLAAVVKGTRFVVTLGKTSASVTVRRGHVEVADKANHQHVTIGAGQTASATSSKSDVLAVTGSGILPAVLAANDQPVTPNVSELVPSKAKDVRPSSGKPPKSEGPKDKGKDAAAPNHKEDGPSADKGKKGEDGGKGKGDDHSGKDKGKGGEGSGKGGNGASLGPSSGGSSGPGGGGGGASGDRGADSDKGPKADKAKGKK